MSPSHTPSSHTAPEHESISRQQLSDTVFRYDKPLVDNFQSVDMAVNRRVDEYF